MKLNLLGLIFVLCLYNIDTIQAQNETSVNTYTIIDELESNTSSSQGEIRIHSDPKITALLGFPVEEVSVSTGKSEYLRMPGFRIHVFMGNNPRQSRSEAFSKEKQIKEVFPDLSTYVTYEAPNWKLLVGDFMTKEEAVVFKQNLQKAFPHFGKEMYTVSDKIKVPVDKM